MMIFVFDDLSWLWSSSEHPDVKPGDGFSVHGCSSCSRHLGSHIGKSGHFGDKDGGDDGDCDDDDCDDHMMVMIVMTTKIMASHSCSGI